MAGIANDTLPVLALFAPAFTPATLARVQLLVVAALLTTGRRTLSDLLRTLGSLAGGAASSYHRVLSAAQWSGLQTGAILARFLAQHFWPAGRITLLGDATVTEHPGQKVYGQGRHRDPVRSSKSYTAYRWGHQWVVLALLLPLPFALRPWALPLLVGLYRSPAVTLARSRKHRTPAPLQQLLWRILLRWSPERDLVFAGDSGHGSHEIARLPQSSQGRLRRVSQLAANANRYEPPPA